MKFYDDADIVRKSRLNQSHEYLKTVLVALSEKGRAKGVHSASMCSASSLGISSFPNEVALKVIQQTEVEAHFVSVEPYAAGKCGKADGKKEE